MTPEELKRFKKEVADPKMKQIFANTVIPEGACFIDRVSIGFLDGRSCGFESVIEASGLVFANGKVQEYQYSETDVSVDEFVEAHKGCAFISDGSLRVYDELDQFEIKTELWNHLRCAKVFGEVEDLGKLNFRYQSMEFEKMKAIFEGSRLVSNGDRADGLPWMVTDIEWDVDCKEEMEGLPTEVEVPGSVEVDEIADFLADKFGFCTKGYVLDEVAEIRIGEEKAAQEPVTLQNAVAIEYKGIIFDDWNVDGETQGVWAEICQCCAEKYGDLIAGELDDAGAIGTCSVDGCDVNGLETENEHHYYIDFKPELIHPLSKEQYEELKKNGSLDEKIQEAQGLSLNDSSKDSKDIEIDR